MALKALIFLLVSLLVVTIRVSADKETFAQVDTLPKTPIKVPAVAPVKAPVAVPVVAPVKAPVAAPVKAPVAAPVKAPVPAPVKAPVPTPKRKPPVKVLPQVPVSACPRLCKVRCALHSRMNRCLRACGTCCKRCRCVPPGTSGNYKKCGKCYADMKTKDNKHKCP